MNSAQRRDMLLELIKKSDKPIKGNELAHILKVSRQVIVQDIALIRASGENIVATPQGYVIFNQNDKIKHKIECNNHNNVEELYEELKTIIEVGGIVEDVIVKHPVYGDIKAELNISSLRDIDKFIDKIKSDKFKQLSTLSEYNHIHTIEVSNEELLDEIIEKLRIKGIISN
ncbi:MAG: 3H domain-containing protein [Peptostreptococcaceae bacterium]